MVDSLRKGHQAMVFVHSRKDTGKSARTLVTKAQNAGDSAVFDCSDQDAYPYMAKDVKRSRNKCANTYLVWNVLYLCRHITTKMGHAMQ